MSATQSPPQPLSAGLHVLHLEDSATDHTLVCRAIRREFPDCEVDRVDNLVEFEAHACDPRYSVILADYRLPGFTALQAWGSLRAYPNNPPFILVSGAIGEAAAVEAIHMGMADYVSKSELDKLGRIIRRALEVHAAHAARTRAALELQLSEARLAAFAEHLQSAIETERASIAREIHDDIGGSLAAVRLDLAWITRHTRDAGLLAHASAAQDMVQHALGASQRIMMDLHPSILDQGLGAAVQWLASGFERRTGTPVQLRCSMDESHPLDKAIQLTAYRTAQESLTNVSKYAQCSRVRVELSDARGVLTLEVHDDGRGIETSDFEKPAAFGLRGLQERARVVGGWLDISSQPGCGTAIILSVPLAGTSPQNEAEFAT